MNTLAPKTHWDEVSAELAATPSRRSRRIPAWLRNAAGDYDVFCVMRILANYPPLKGQSILEIGSSPGTFLAQFAAAYGCQPSGVEYTHAGAELTRRTFAAYGFDPSSVVEADVFSEAYTSTHREKFDVVLSRGFIEHFTDVASVIRHHIGLVKPGGKLIVSVPNLRGFNEAVLRRVHPVALTWHNLTIMDRQAFVALFQQPDLSSLFCGYYGAINWWLFYADDPLSRWGRALRAVQRTQPILNLLARGLLRGRTLGAWGGAGLIYIGRKTSSAAR